MDMTLTLDVRLYYDYIDYSPQSNHILTESLSRVAISITVMQSVHCNVLHFKRTEWDN